MLLHAIYGMFRHVFSFKPTCSVDDGRSNCLGIQSDRARTCLQV